jgi:hypothetical protein
MGKELSMTKKELFNRFETAYKMGLLTPEIFQLMDRWTDAFMRLEGGQFNYFMDAMIQERERTDRFAMHKTLANDRDGYKVIQLMAILTHHCQACAEDTEAWHTRAGFCQHRKEK